ncbi:class I SAM-dependent methyltransferase [Actinokineospora globicatena]|uniref:class I SAM-dependent methyltransferase n=1 Tax=Actinokineospora globicatena TaxID=103729 RepID=UPI0020A3BC49|nr:class I SAM-dependent methyltransferase [Actinokineospora globicatena]GLW76056.1 methyltransferase [Actinokineospora globicatena]GLW82891.1 methyltransferase [Actinokineospora globicatena]
MVEPATISYVFATSFAREEERLSLGEHLWDPGTTSRLAGLGVGRGTRCLEIGAGHGSIAAWMAECGASVTAVDIDTSRLGWLRGCGVSVHRSDISRDPLPGSGYDVVHARLVVQHLADRVAAVRRMVSALRPGGYLVLEDTDTATTLATAEGVLRPRVRDAAYAVMAESGYHPRCGLLDVDLALSAGLRDVRAEGRAEVITGGTPQGRWFALWLEHLRPAMVERGLVTRSEVDAAIAELDDPGTRWLSQVMITVIGRKGADERAA